MGKIVLSALVGIWMFNLVRLVAAGLPGQVVAEKSTAYADPGTVPVAEAAPFAADGAETLAPGAFEIRGARAVAGTPTTVSIGLRLPESGAVDLQLLDPSQRRILTQGTHRLPAGISSVQLQAVERLEPGSYWIRVRAGDQVVTTAVTING
jgi:hypothetical protein